MKTLSMTIPFNMGNRQKHGLFEKNRGRELRKTEPDCKKPRKIGHSCMLRGLPLRTARKSFDLKRLASGLCFELVPLRSFSMNGLVALLTDNQGSLRLPRSLITPKTVSAFRISRTSTSGSSGHLSPFAMCPDFPDSDYYGDSVAPGLASRRRSRVPLVLNVSSVT